VAKEHLDRLTLTSRAFHNDQMGAFLRELCELGGYELLIGMDRNRGPVDAIASGVLAYLPGIPPRTVTDRQGYVQARIDYLNHLFNSNAYLVSAADTRQLQHLQLLIPRVIVLLLFDRMPRKEVKFTRHNIFERDKNTCQYCARPMPREQLNLDHVIPRDRGGPTTWENIVCSCIECNTRKANRTPTEAGMHLVRKPKRPKWRPFLQINFSLHHHDSWKHFVDLAYWNVELGE